MTSSKEKTVGRTTPVSWSAADKSFLVDCLFEHRDKGNQTDSGFKPVVFADIATQLWEQGSPENGLEKSVEAVKNKYNNAG
jgi:hypothetical protein